MNVTICSAFRNAVHYLPRYLEQIDCLDYALKGKLSFVWGEGDSTDNTRKLLQANTYRFRAQIVDCSHGGALFGSIVHAQRFKQLAHVGNTMLAAIPQDVEAVVLLDSDLIWEAATLVVLIHHLATYPAIAPMIFHKDDPGLYAGYGPFFYDTFAFRRGQIRFSNMAPYHPDHPDEDRAVLQMDSAGGCLAMRGELARQVHFSADEVIVGLCKEIYQCGESVWLDPSLSIFHP